MSVTKMIITLDDVSCLLHLPVTSKPIDDVLSQFDREAMKILPMTHLGIPIETDVATAAHTSVRVRLM